MSPGRSMSRMSDISLDVSTPPMWHITLAPPPALVAASIDRRSGSMPFLAMTFSDMRTLTPMAMSEFSATALAQASTTRVVDVVELRHRKRRQADIGDVHESIETRARLSHHIAAERGEVVGAGIARRHHGGGGLKRQQFVRRDADRGAVGIDMSMQVDEAGGHELAADVQDLERPFGGNVGLHRLDDAPTDADVAPAPQVLAGIEHLAALDEEVELVVRPHRRERGTAAEPAGSERQQRCGLRQEPAAGRNDHGHSSE